MFLKCCLLLTLVNISIQIHPRYSYVCKENGTVEFKGFKSGSTITIIKSVLDTCNGTLFLDAKVVTITKECMGSELKENRTITIQVKDGNVNDGGIDENSNAQHDKSKIIGGLESHTFTLTCNHITNVHRTVLRQFHLKDQEVIYEKENEIASVDMRFKGTDDIKDPDISEAFIGDEFYMFLKYKGDSDYKLVPNTCIAYEGNDYKDTNTHSETLWNFTTDHAKHCVSDNAEKFHLMGVDGFTYVDTDDKTVKARLNAFRFKDNNDVTIFCDVSLFPHATVADNENVCPLPLPTSTSRRKKRASSSQLNSRVVKTIVIKEKNKDNSNHGTFVTPSLILQMVSSVVGLIVMKKVSQ